MPLAEVLNLISKPPGSAPPFIPYKPVPYLVPLPSKHTLTVKRPNSLSPGAFGELREDNLQLIIQVREGMGNRALASRLHSENSRHAQSSNRTLSLQAKPIIKTQTQTRTESIEAARVEAREPWKLPESIFKPRVKECDSKGFWDSDECYDKMFERDWARACAKEKFTGEMDLDLKYNHLSIVPQLCLSPHQACSPVRTSHASLTPRTTRPCSPRSTTCCKSTTSCGTALSCTTQLCQARTTCLLTPTRLSLTTARYKRGINVVM